jgi:DNA-binding MarR family transcriptional regulator
MITTPVTGAVTGPVTGAVASAAAGAECEELAAALEQLVSMWRRLAVPGELSSTAAFTLARLSRDGPCRLTELAAHEKVSQPGMTQLVSRLEGQGLAERCSEPGDARVVKVAVTAAGEELIARRRAARAARFAEFFAMLPVPHQAALASALPALQLLAEAGAGAGSSQ